MDHADGKKRPLKTFGKRQSSDKPSVQLSSSIQRSSLIDSILGDENDRLQAQINQIIQDDLVPKKMKLALRSEFMTELDNLSSDEEFDQFAHGIRRSKNVKCVHELVEAGENSRFFDEIEYLVEGLCSGSEESRTLSLEELTKKVFCTPGFGGRMRAHGKLAMTIDMSFCLAHKGRVRGCLALLLINLCHELRKLDAFISTERLVHLSKLLLQDESQLSSLNLAYLKQTQVFKEMKIAQCPVRVLGLWLLAKVCQSTSQSSSKEEVDRLVDLLTTSDIEHSLVSFLEAQDGELDEFGSIQLRWCLVPLQCAFTRSLLETIIVLVGLLKGCDRDGPQKSLLASDIARVLVCLTGSDNYHLVLSKDHKLVDLILDCFLSKIRSEEAMSVSICLVSALVNLVDRSTELCASVSNMEKVLELASQFSGLSPDLKVHVGLLIAFIVSSSDSPQRILSLVPAYELNCQVSSIMDQYRSAHQLTPQLEQTFTALLARDRRGLFANTGVMMVRGNLCQIITLVLLGLASLAQGQCESVLTIWRTTTVRETSTLVTTSTQTTTFITTTTFETTRTRSTTTTATTTSSVFTTRTLSTTERFTTFITTTDTLTRTTITYITETVNTTRTLTRTTQFTETTTDSTLVVRSTRQILSGTVTSTSTRTTKTQVTTYRSTPRTSTTQVTKYIPATRTIFSTRVTTISMTITGSFTATDLISNDGAVLVRPLWEMDPVGGAAVLLGLVAPLFLL